MNRTTELLAVGSLSGVIAVSMLLLVEMSLFLAIPAALGAAIPVSVVYGMLTFDANTTERSHGDDAL